MGELYIGLISGTSVDGVDAVIAELDDARCQLHATATIPYPDGLRGRIRALIEQPNIAVEDLGRLDAALGSFFAQCVLGLVEGSSFELGEIEAVGHHGQTVFHKPDPPEPFTLQLGDPNAIAAATGITTVADFRRLDMALGGQGAPLAPVFHEWCFADADEVRVALNIGGIANLTLLHPQLALSGFDTGPGNTLMDLWTQRCLGRPYDSNGEWAASGRVLEPLLNHLMSDPFFARTAPKSTGREYFHMEWLQAGLDAMATPGPVDVQATLAELTAATVADAIKQMAPVARVILCGGGAHNNHLVERLRARLPGTAMESSQEHGIGPDWVEAAAFAWLARARLQRLEGNRPSVTGARQGAVLGGVYCGRS